MFFTYAPCAIWARGLCNISYSDVIDKLRGANTLKGRHIEFEALIREACKAQEARADT